MTKPGPLPDSSHRNTAPSLPPAGTTSHIPSANTFACADFDRSSQISGVDLCVGLGDLLAGPREWVYSRTLKSRRGNVCSSPRRLYASGRPATLAHVETLSQLVPLLSPLTCGGTGPRGPPLWLPFWPPPTFCGGRIGCIPARREARR